jgi:membrane protease YdiL (CAAX protease family)
LIPLIRIISVAIPLSGIPEGFEFIAVSIPLFITGVIIAKIVGLTYTDLGFKFDGLHNKLLIGLLGILLGFAKFLLFQPGEKDISTVPEGLLMWVFILLFLGFLEEFLYRGIIYIILLRVLSHKEAVYFTSFLYATLTISTKSFVNVLFAFLVSIIFCGLFTRYKSLTGLYLAHGLMNITFYVICPLIF